MIKNYEILLKGTNKSKIALCLEVMIVEVEKNVF